MKLGVENITKNFGGILALANVSFEVAVGEIVGLVGPNGSGKTTLFNVIAGTYAPSQGRVLLDTRDITNFPPWLRARLGISRTYQIPRPLHELSVLDNVLVPLCLAKGLPLGMSSRSRALELLSFVGLESKAGELTHHLSLIELKRLELARALALEPKFLLLDEVFSGLSPSEVEAAYGLVESISRSGVGVVVVEHNMRLVMRLCERVVVLSFGQKIAEGTPHEIASHPEVIKAYLGEEYAQD
jgi:branched-chain amino acid transport system ATP-binding protein